MQPRLSQPILEYGAQHRGNLRRIAVKALAVLALIVVAGAALLFAWSRLYLYEETSVRMELESIPGGRVTDINSFDDPPGVKVISADVSLGGGSTKSCAFALRVATYFETATRC